AIDQVAAETWPDPRDDDELHDALLTLICLNPVPEWGEYFDELALTGRASVIRRNGQAFWVATERASMANDPAAVVSGWMESIGPVTVKELAGRLAFPEPEVEDALLRLEGQGLVLRGKFRNADEWCNRRILARIHRTTLG